MSTYTHIMSGQESKSEAASHALLRSYYVARRQSSSPVTTARHAPLGHDAAWRGGEPAMSGVATRVHFEFSDCNKGILRF